MKKIFLLLILSFFSAQGLAGECPDGSEPTRSVSADGSYYVYTCGGQSSSSSSTSNNIPPNAYASGSGWKCKTLYYENNNYCSKLPANAASYGSGDGFYCKSGYEKTGLSCIAKIKTEDAYKKAKTAYENKDYQTAFKEFTVLAKTGNEKAQSYLGYMYDMGYGVTKDYKLAVSWYRKSANQGYSTAQNNLGTMYENGDGVTKDYKLAVSWYRKAANQGNSRGQANLGYLYRKGWGVTKDYKLAVSWYRKAANQGNSRGQNNLGYMYEFGNGVTKDYKQAVSWYRKAANQGDDFGQWNLGAMYEDGKGVAQNDKLALSWYRKAANQGHSEAKKDLKALELKIKNKEDEAKTIIPANAYASSSDSKGWKCKTLYYENNNYCLKLPSNAIARTYGDGFYCKSGYRKSTVQNACVKKSNIPANAYASGDGWICKSGYIKRGNFCRENIKNGYWTYDGSTMKCYTGYEKTGLSCIAKIKTEDAYKKAKTAYENKDYQTAFREFTVLAKSGNEKAQNYIGAMYQDGEGVTKDLKQAVSWYRKAANQGYSTAQFNLGYMYRNGYGVTKNDKLAVSWYRKAANQGYSTAQYNLGYMYRNGYGVTKDYKLAVSWYRKAANQGYSPAQNNLGYMYRKGYGVTKNDKLALSWFRKAANQGYSSAQNNLGTMYKYGYGVTKDSKLALSWFRKAANQGNSTAQNNLGRMYENGNGVTKGYKLAVSWYQKAADQGYDYAQWHLGAMYEDGKGVAQNDKLALSWYRKAANQGHSEAKKDLKALELKIKNKEDEAKTIIPANAYASSSDSKGWKCKTLYYENNNYCLKLPSNAIARTYGDGFYCKSGYRKSTVQNACVKKSNIPANAYASGDGWICKSGYIKRGNFCRENIKNGYWTYDGSTMKCYTGFKKVGVRCENELIDDQLLPAASGTGFAVTSDGYVVTNNHVIKGCTSVEIYYKGKAIQASVVNIDPIIDLALIKGNFTPEKFYYLSPKNAKLRTPVDVIGYGFGKKISSYVKVTRGIISSVVGIQNDSSRFQIDAALQPGNSGGPIIDSNGNVVGVAVEKISIDWAKENLSALPENIGFGIKSSAVINFLDGNNIKYSTPDNKTKSFEDIGELIDGGTYYLSCLMTLSQIERIQKQKVLFNDLQ